jgi:CHAT domain-containing protein
MTDDLHPGACPGDEQLAAYAEGLLSEEERLAVERHLAECETCREVVAEAVRLRELDVPVVTPSTVKPVVVVGRFGRRRAMAVGGGVLALAASLILVVQVRPELNPFRRPTPYEELVAAVGTNRSVEGRLSGGFHYGPAPSSTRAAGNPSAADYRLLAAAARIEQAATQRRTPENLHALGVAHLLIGRHDEAIAVLEEALGPSKTPDIAADLASAYIARGNSDARTDDYVRALAYAEQAISSDPSLIEAHFNRALALEHLELRERAVVAWESYLAIDSTSEWALEARSHRDAATSLPQSRIDPRGVSGSDPSPYFSAVLEREYLPAWALSGKQEDLKALKALAGRFEAETGERFWSDLAKALDSAGPDVRRAIQRYLAGRQAYENDANSIASGEFSAAQTALKAERIPLYYWTQYYASIRAYYEGDLPRASSGFERIVSVAEDNGYIELAARGWWMLGLLAQIDTRYTDALTAYSTAGRLFTAVRDADSVAAVEGLTADALGYLGQTSVAWDHLRRALRERVVQPRRRHTILRTGVRLATADQRPEVALQLQLAVLANAESWRQPGALTEAHLGLAALYSASKLVPEAQRHLASAQSWIEQVPDPLLRRRFDGELVSAIAEVELLTAPRVADKHLTLAIESARWRGADYDQARLHLLRARARLRASAPDEAASDLQAATEFVNRSRRQIASAPLRVSALDRAWRVFDEVVQFHLSRGESDAALYVAEAGRALSAPPVDARWRTPRCDAVSADRRDAAILYYVSLPNELATWAFTPSGTYFHLQALPSADIERMVNELERAMTSSDGVAFARIAGALYARLVAPLHDRVETQRVLIVVPDGALNAVPFAGLPHRGGGFMNDHHALAQSPSLRLACAALRRHSIIGDGPVLIVGDPAGAERDSLSRLPYAREEARRVATSYESALELTGVDASKLRFLNELTKARMVHFAGHAIVNPVHWSLSRLVLSDGSEGSASLFAYEIEGLNLSSIDLVILSACESAKGSPRRGQGAMSLARPFLVAGVATVIATLWRINDEQAQVMAVLLHDELQQGVGAIEALRNAQMKYRRTHLGQASTQHWAAYAAIIG